MDAKIFERWVRAHEEADRETLAELMHEEFVFEQAGLSDPLDKEEYLTLVEALHRAFPDLDVEAETHTIDDGLVEWQQRFAATHERDLDLTRLGLPFFWSTGTDVDVDADTARTRIDDGRVRAHAIDDPQAGIAGLIAEIETGVEEIRQEARQHEPKAPGVPSAYANP